MLLNTLFGLVLLGALTGAEQSEMSKQTLESFDSNDVDLVPARSNDVVDYLIEVPRSQFGLLRVSSILLNILESRILIVSFANFFLLIFSPITPGTVLFASRH